MTIHIYIQYTIYNIHVHTYTYMKSVELLDDFGEFAVGFSLDSPGYTAADLATLAGFHATAEKINALGALWPWWLFLEKRLSLNIKLYNVIACYINISYDISISCIELYDTNDYQNLPDLIINDYQITVDHLIFLDPFEDGWTMLEHFSIGLG